MIKKILNVIKFCLVGILWSGIYGYIARNILIKFWHFDIFYRKQWVVVEGFWNSNGVIYGMSDYLLLMSLLFLLLFWVFGWYKIYKIKVSNLLLSLINYFQNRKLQQYEDNAQHVVIKNIKVGEKMTIEDIIQDRIKQEKVDKSQEAKTLRQKISEKIINYKEQ